MKFINRNSFQLDNYRLTPEEYQLKISERPRPIVLDIRAKLEVECGTVEHAYSMPAEEFSDCLIQLPPFGAIILYSDENNNQIEACLKILFEHGFNDIAYVDGGYKAIMADLIEISEPDKVKIAKMLREQKKKGIILDLQAYSVSYQLAENNPDLSEYKYIELDNFKIYFSHNKLRLIKGTKISYQEGKITFDHSRWKQKNNSEDLSSRVQKVLDQEINPMVASHGGFVKLIQIDDDVAYVEMAGGCQGCGLSAVTLKQGVEAAIFHSVPEIAEVLDTTKHEEGVNPYY